MGRKKFRDEIITADDALAAHAVLRVTCTRCGHDTNMYAWKIYNVRRTRVQTMLIGKPVPGFRCRGCRRLVDAVLTVAGFVDYGT